MSTLRPEALPLLVFAGLLAAAAPAQAGLGLLVQTDSGDLDCEPLTPCNPDLCPGLECACPDAFTCEPLNAQEHVCATSDGLLLDTVCWTSEGSGGTPYCPLRGGAPGTCVFPSDPSTSGLCICIYPDKFDYCLGPLSGDVLSEAQTVSLSACLQVQGDLLTWRGGDCDADDLVNAEDCCPCDSDRCCTTSDRCDPTMATPSCAILDASVGIPDAAPDASPEDAGFEPEPLPEDAGHDTFDAGTRIATTPSFNGDGGCRVARTGHGGPPLLFLFPALLWLLRRRTRAATR